jgi:hypothetical protein
MRLKAYFWGMKRHLTLVTVTAAFALAAQFCIKPPDYPDTPGISFTGLSKNVMQQGRSEGDSVTISFSYTDGDGDLGYPKADTTTSVFVKDNRDSFVKFRYKLPYVDPQGAGNGISGQISIVIPTSCCIFETPEGIKLACENVPSSFRYDTLYYFISIRDRAGNISNEIKAGPIALKCQ